MAPKQRGATRGGSYDSRLKGLAGADFYSGPVTSGLIPENYWGDTEASSTWSNPYFIENSPLKTNDRYDYTIPGSGLSNSANNSLGFSGLPMAIDRAFATQWLSPIDVGTPLESAAKKLAAGDYSQLGLALGQRKLSGDTRSLSEIINKSKSELDPDYVGAVKHNQQYENYKNAFKTYTTNPDYLWAWDQIGIDPKTLTSPEALAAIAPEQKAAVFDLVGRSLQQKNQRENWGLKDSFGLALSLGSGFVGNPYAAIALGAAGAGVRGEGIGGIIKGGALAGLSNWAGGKVGEYLSGTGGFTNPGALGDLNATDLYRSAALGETAGNVVTTGAALGGTAGNVFGALPGSLKAATTAANIYNTAGGIGSLVPAQTGAALGITPADVFGGTAGNVATTGSALGGTAADVFDALPTHGTEVVGNAGVYLGGSGVPNMPYLPRPYSSTGGTGGGFTNPNALGITPADVFGGTTTAPVTGTGIGTKVKDAITGTGLGSLVTNVVVPSVVTSLAEELLAESPPTPPDDSSSDSQGGTDSMTQGVGSLPQTTSSFVDPTPYLGRGALRPAFMNQFERAELGLA